MSESCKGGCGKTDRLYRLKEGFFCFGCRRRLFKQVAHSCGHHVFYPRTYQDDQDQIAVWPKSHWRQLSDERCLRCQNLLKGAEALIKAQERGLPLLTGTTAQIHYAAHLRESYLTQIEKYRTLALESLTKDPVYLYAPKTRALVLEAIEEKASKLKNDCHEETEARWWIEKKSALFVLYSWFGQLIIDRLEEARAERMRRVYEP